MTATRRLDNERAVQTFLWLLDAICRKQVGATELDRRCDTPEVTRRFIALPVGRRVDVLRADISRIVAIRVLATRASSDGLRVVAHNNAVILARIVLDQLRVQPCHRRWTDKVVIEVVHLRVTRTVNAALTSGLDRAVTVEHVAVDDPEQVLPAGEVGDLVIDNLCGQNRCTVARHNISTGSVDQHLVEDRCATARKQKFIGARLDSLINQLVAQVDLDAVARISAKDHRLDRCVVFELDRATNRPRREVLVGPVTFLVVLDDVTTIIHAVRL